MIETLETEPLKIPPAYEVVVQELRRAIHLGLYRPGDKLPPERVHATMLGVSRVTLREAIRVLEGEGYLRTKRGSHGGVFVLDPGESRPRVLERLREDSDELSAIAEFRLVNERLAAERAATRISPEQLEYLATSIEALRASESIGDFRRADSQFHLAIAGAADCGLLQKAVEDSRAAMFLPLDVVDLKVVHPSSLKAHNRILRALEEGSAKDAGRHMASHLSATNQELAELLGRRRRRQVDSK